MADVADVAQIEIDSYLAAACSAAIHGAQRLIPSGHCHNCDDPIHPIGSLFCDRHCADDYELRGRQLALQGMRP
jgi:hypothetical protein